MMSPTRYILEPRRRKQRGAALIMVLIVIVLVTLGAYSFTEMMVAQQRGSLMHGRQAQARAAAASGVSYLLDFLAQPPDVQLTQGGLYNNAAVFQDITVSTETDGIIRFSIVSIEQDSFGEPIGVRYGVQDEGAKINVNQLVLSDLFDAEENVGASSSGGGGDEGGGGDDGGGGRDGAGGGGAGGGGAGGDGEGGSPPDDDNGGLVNDLTESDADPFSDPKRNVLLALPGMTETTADAILDWIDEDNEPRAFGAESESYGVLGYAPRNGSINSLDELLLVQGVTPELLYGSDRNHNGLLDESESAGVINSIGGMASMSRGWSAFLTVASRDVPPESTVEPIDLNQDDLQALYDAIVAAPEFDEDMATYIVAYRQGGPYSPPDDPDAEIPESEAVGGRTVNLSQQGGQTFESALDLIGSQTLVNFEGDDEPTLIDSPFANETGAISEFLPNLMGNLVVGESSDGGEGRININQACQAVLVGLPGVSETMVQSVAGLQDPTGMSTDLNMMYATWPLAFGATTLEEMKELLPFITVNGGIYRAQVIGYSDIPGAYARIEVVIDATEDTPRVLSWRDLSHLGLGFPLDSFITATQP